MSERVDTELDLTVLDALDFEPACELKWPDVHGEGENATHVARPGCCGSPRLMGQACIQALWQDRMSGGHYTCNSCGESFAATTVTLDPLS